MLGTISRHKRGEMERFSHWDHSQMCVFVLRSESPAHVHVPDREKKRVQDLWETGPPLGFWCVTKLFLHLFYINRAKHCHTFSTVHSQRCASDKICCAHIKIKAATISWLIDVNKKKMSCLIGWFGWLFGTDSTFYKWCCSWQNLIVADGCAAFSSLSRMCPGRHNAAYDQSSLFSDQKQCKVLHCTMRETEKGIGGWWNSTHSIWKM